MRCRIKRLLMSWDWEYTTYTSAAERRRRAERDAKKLGKDGNELQPICIAGSKIATSFWGKSWCASLESYSDYSNRLPRGRSYVRSGAVLDLRITPGVIEAQVSGSSLYEITVEIDAVSPRIWDALKSECAGQIGSLFDLLQGKLSAPVMEIMTRRGKGLFPHPHEIVFGCTCPDEASMCKHVAAVLYGVGARLDASPELLFVLRGADHLELVAEAADSVTGDVAAGAESLASGALSEIFGIELADGALPVADAAPKTPSRGKKAPKPGGASKSVKGKPSKVKKGAGRPPIVEMSPKIHPGARKAVPKTKAVRVKKPKGKAKAVPKRKK